MSLKRRIMTVLLASAVLAVFAAGSAVGEEKKTIKGTIKSMDASSGVVVVTDKDGKDVTVVLGEKEKLNKFSVGDRVKVQAVEKDGKNSATDFRKAAGC